MTEIFLAVLAAILVAIAIVSFVRSERRHNAELREARRLRGKSPKFVAFEAICTALIVGIILIGVLYAIFAEQ